MKVEINASRSKIILINDKEAKKNRNNEINYKGRELKVLSTYEYLGTLIINDVKIDLEISNRTEKANRIYYALNSRKGKKEMNKKIKLEVNTQIHYSTNTNIR